MASTYLPPRVTNDTHFPKAFEKDLRQQIRMIEDLYRLQMPEILYYTQSKAVTSACAEQADDADPLLAATVVGATGTTQWDPLWGESVPASVATAGWEQPHGSDTHDATDSRGVFLPAVKLNARIQREAKDYTLKRLGFDKIRDLLVYIPTSLLDAHAVVVEPGDEFEWDGERFQVLQRRRDGWWKNTNIRLYVAINAEHARVQSS